MMQFLLLAAALQQATQTSPPSGDTVGYWQQRVAYRIVATLDEAGQRLRARGELTYVNNSPDTLREMYVHQHLNAFRPGSKWSEADRREGRVRFQNLRDPDYAYERFTRPPTVDGVGVRVEYPGAPDSTVARLTLPRPLRPRDSVRVSFDWDARPSTLPRRQGRRGRQWDFAQWYPRVAVYDRGGWQHNPLRPAGEFYGEFGTYDVTLVVRDDQVIGSTGVPVSGDPGWHHALRAGEAHTMRDAYADLPPAPAAEVPEGFKAVRFVARDVHHFAWSASPEYRYEGGAYVRDAAADGGARVRFPTWDTVAVHVLYRPGDDTTWGGRRALRSTIAALRWLESVYGPYAYPQMTNLHRIEGGGTEFPMLMMNGSPSPGLILHEGGHIFTHGILANNEWRSGWMDEGLTSYQTSWALGQTPQERARSGRVEPPGRLPEGYRINAVTIPRRDSAGLGMLRLELLGRTEPIGTVAHEFREFAVYNVMIYDRAEMMYGQLRDVIGDDAFRRFLRDYYHRWALKHVDERAMRAAAERAGGRDLGWFFAEWVHHVGLLDYALRDVNVERATDGRWLTRALVVRRGDYQHPMPVGVRTSTGWTIARGNALADRQVVDVITAERPQEIRLDPFHTTVDWDRRNDKVADAVVGRAKYMFDWPFLDQADRERSIVAFLPMAWYSEPGGYTVGARARSSYLTWLDRRELGVAVAARRSGPDASMASQLQVWARAENPYLPFFTRPLVGQRGGIAFLDGIAKLDWTRSWDLSPFFFARGPRISASATVTGAYPSDRAFLPESWNEEGTTDLSGVAAVRLPLAARTVDSIYARLGGVVGYADGTSAGVVSRGYGRLEAEVQGLAYADSATRVSARIFAGASANAPAQRALYAAARDPISTFENHFYRPRGAALKKLTSDVSRELAYLPLGGAALRGYGPTLALDRVLATNVEARRQLVGPFGGARGLSLWAAAFADVAIGRVDGAANQTFFADLGPGVSLRGRLYDRDVQIRVDLPLYTYQRGREAASVFLTFNDLW
ncbi:MAG: M1 family metallopeptidase [Gemmatimonadaceae bacterium]